MWIRQVILAFLGISAGITAAGGLFAFIVGLGVVSDFADRTHTGSYVMLYEDCIALGGILGSIFYIFRISIPYGGWILPVFGLLSGIFVGCWAMALAEIINIFPIFVRRLKIVEAIPYLILGMALGKGAGAWIFLVHRW
ncbi:stage V sporulation protein AB [Hespellia stercorisuis]|uniref:Stage V sporulation protein AB n=1 Tax=Hespellia stercorisuis DSM 15480 TaxID=1121950 RepID=A0A1M6NH84_9FIRM|nr:stage V sporulation protein AB [Hespellia stercorisuis]SHJ95060.1 stage V sporulation protein AB [Hespellia stercorisuis DSM 15480]